MATPTSAITRFDLSLGYAEFDERMNREGFVGLQVLPPVMVGRQSGTFRRIPVEALLGKIEDTKRAPKSGYLRDDFEWETDSYVTDDHGVEEPMDDRTLAMYRNEIDAEAIHARRAINRVLMPLENEIAAAVFNATTWTSYKTAVSTAWSTAASAKPITDIDAAIESVKSQCGTRPNTLILSDYALRKMKRTAQVEDLLKYSGRDDPKNLGVISGLQELLDIEKIIVADGFKNTADDGQDASFSRLWDTTMAMVCCTGDSPDLEDRVPRIGATIMWGEETGGLPGLDGEGAVIVEEYREEKVRGGVLRARLDYQVKIIHVEAGHLLTGVTA